MERTLRVAASNNCKRRLTSNKTIFFYYYRLSLAPKILSRENWFIDIQLVYWYSGLLILVLHLPLMWFEYWCISILSSTSYIKSYWGFELLLVVFLVTSYTLMHVQCQFAYCLHDVTFIQIVRNLKTWAGCPLVMLCHIMSYYVNTCCIKLEKMCRKHATKSAKVNQNLHSKSVT